MSARALAKVKISRNPELEEDFDMFRLHRKREVSKALVGIGEIKHLVIVT
jgi:hypothetical protein